MQSVTLSSTMSNNTQALEEILGVSTTTETDELIAYVGDESRRGFKFQEYDSSLQISLYDDDQDITNYSVTSDGELTLYYENGTLATVFGVKNSNNDGCYIQCAIVPYKAGSDTGKAFIMMSGQGKDSSATINAEVLCDDGDFFTTNSGLSIPTEVTYTLEIISLAPFVHGNKIFPTVAIPYACPGGFLGVSPFTLNGYRYIPLGANICVAMD